MRYITNAVYLARNDVRAMYRKTVLGPLWPVLLNLIGVLGMSLVWARLLGQPMHTFIPSVTLGMIAWQFISGLLSGGSISMFQYAPIIRNVPMPPYFFVLRSLARQTVIFLHNIPIIIGMMLFLQVPLTAATLLVLPGFVLLVLHGFWITYVLGITGARMRDLQHMITAVLPMLFFITPVMFRIDHLPAHMDLVLYNPLAYGIEALRMPLLGLMPPAMTYPVLIGGLVPGFGLAAYIHVRHAHRLAFWV